MRLGIRTIFWKDVPLQTIAESRSLVESLLLWRETDRGWETRAYSTWIHDHIKALARQGIGE